MERNNVKLRKFNFNGQYEKLCIDYLSEYTGYTKNYITLETPLTAIDINKNNIAEFAIHLSDFLDIPINIDVVAKFKIVQDLIDFYEDIKGYIQLVDDTIILLYELKHTTLNIGNFKYTKYKGDDKKIYCIKYNLTNGVKTIYDVTSGEGDVTEETNMLFKKGKVYGDTITKTK